jgi:ligand-binding sensor domain-containing protein
VNDGLESNTVYDIAQDDQGFMWFATKGALTRFDSQNFKIFKKNIPDSLSIGNNFIRVIKKFTSDSFLFGTEDGIYLFDLKTEVFKRIHPKITRIVYDILVEKDGYWIATDGEGLFFYDIIKKEIKNYSTLFGNSKNVLGINRARAIVKDDMGRLWVGTYGNGMYVLNLSDNTVLNYKAGFESGSISNNFILTMFKGLDGTIWCGTLGGGLNRWSFENKRFYSYEFKEGKNSISDNIVRTINQRSRDELLIGTEKGLSILNLESNKFTSYKNSSDPNSLSDNAVWSIFIDKEKNVWIGTYFGGVNYLNLSENTIKHFYKKSSDPNSLKGNAVSCFYEDEDKKLWIGTEDGGLNYFNPKTGDFLELPKGLNIENLSYPNVHAGIND